MATVKQDRYIHVCRYNSPVLSVLMYSSAKMCVDNIVQVKVFKHITNCIIQYMVVAKYVYIVGECYLK